MAFKIYIAAIFIFIVYALSTGMDFKAIGTGILLMSVFGWIGSQLDQDDYKLKEEFSSKTGRFAPKSKETL